MLNREINVLLNRIAEPRNIHGADDGRWCRAYNTLLRLLRHDRPARTMLEFGMFDLRGGARKRSHRQRIVWLRRHLAATGARWQPPHTAYFAWSRAVEAGRRDGRQIAHHVNHVRRSFGSAYFATAFDTPVSVHAAARRHAA